MNHEILWTLEKQTEGFEGEVCGTLNEPGGGYYEGTYCMEHWVWCINNEFCYTEKKFKNK